jgi:hypothetical protein
MVQKLSNSGTWSSPVQVSSLDGTPGKDGSDIEFVYYRNKGSVTGGLDAPTDSTTIEKVPENITDKDGGAWYKGPLGITDEWTYEYMSVRTKPAGATGETEWSKYSTPVIWSKWGDKGQDGDGVKYIYYLSNSSTAPGKPAKATDGKWKTDGIEWSDDPQGATEEQQYEYVSKITVTTNADGSKNETVSKPALWAKYANDAQAIRIVSDKY